MPAITFNADEVFTMAEQIEKNGANFYRVVADRNPSSREFLIKLAEMEDQHYKIFNEMHEKLTDREKEPTAADPDGHMAQFSQTFANKYVFDVTADPAAKLTGKETPEDIFVTAIGLEKDSIVFYLGIKNMLSSDSGRSQIERIIQEEMNHIAWLGAQRAKRK